MLTFFNKEKEVIGENAMAEKSFDHEALKSVVRQILPEVLQEYSVKQLEQVGHSGQTDEPNCKKERRDIDFVERMVRAEEAIVHLHELIKEQMRLIDKRFEQLEKRFEQVDKRFEQVDKRFEDMQRYMDKRFNMLQWLIGLSFAGISVLMGVLNYL